jgi:hypothetical protein
MAQEKQQILESILHVKYLDREIKGDTKVTVASETEVEARTDYERSTAEALARVHLQRMLSLKRTRDAIRSALEEKLQDFNVVLEVDKYPRLSRALQRISDGESNTDLTWPVISRAYALHRNAPGIGLGFDPVAALYGEIGPNGEYLITPNDPVASDATCAEIAEGPSVTPAVDPDAHNNSVDNSDFPVNPSHTNVEAIESVLDLQTEGLFWQIIVTFFYVMAELFFNTLADFFNVYRKLPIVKKLIRKVVKALRALAAYFRCLYQSVGVPGGGDACMENVLAEYYPEDEFDEDGEKMVDAEEDGAASGVLGAALSNVIHSNSQLDCIEASSAVMQFVKSRSTLAGQIIDGPDWDSILMALVMEYSDDVFANTSQALLDMGDFGEGTDQLNDDITVSDATTELTEDNKRKPLYRVRYHGSSRDRWTQLTTP